MRGRGGKGFTLIEALLALAIFSALAVLAYRATVAMTDGEARLATEAQRWRALDATFARFEADIRQAIPRSVRNGVAREPAWLGTTATGGDGALVFTRAGSEFAADPFAAGQRVGYRLHEGAFELAYWPRLDHDGSTRPVTYPLLRDIASLQLAYLTRQGEWRAQWPVAGEPELPRAVKLALTLADGTRIERWFTLQ